MSDEMITTLVRVKSGDPDQCQCIRSLLGTQCIFKVVEGSRYCIMHGGNRTITSNRVKDLNNYRLGKYQTRVSELANNPNLRSIDEEIGILRMILESIIEKCESNVDLMLFSQRISDLIQDITRCVNLADKLATKSGMLIGRSEALLIGEKIIDIISTHITDERILLQIAEQISDSLLTKVEGTDGSNIS
jgi:hypothetical protein